MSNYWVCQCVLGLQVGWVKELICALALERIAHSYRHILKGAASLRSNWRAQSRRGDRPHTTAKMCDMGGLDNLVANTAYLKAQGGDDKEMKKRRRSLSLPKPEQCAAARSTIEKDFTMLCERQPIGKKFFRDFLATNNDYKLAAEFLDELYDWDLAEGAPKDKARQNIMNKYCKADSKSFLSFLTGEAAEKCKSVTDATFGEVMKGKVQEGVREYLKDKPFTDYQASPFFDKFLQWKEYEKQPISDKYFYEFRTLGKGGFGEVRNTSTCNFMKVCCKHVLWQLIYLIILLLDVELFYYHHILFNVCKNA